MDRNTVIGLVLIGLILVGYTWYGSKQTEKRQIAAREQFVRDSIANPEKYSRTAAQTDEERRHADAEFIRRQQEAEEAGREAMVANLGQSLVDASNGVEETYVMENDLMKIYISSKGGKVSNIELKKYNRYGGDTLRLYKEGTAEFDMTLFIRRQYNETQLSTANYFFVSDSPRQVVVDDRARTLALRLPVDEQNGSYIEYLYTLTPGEYMVDFDVRFVNMREMTGTLTSFDINWKATSLQNEKGFKNENVNTTIAFRNPGSNKVTQLGASEGGKNNRQPGSVEWVNFKQQYFSTVMIADENFSDANMSFATYKEGTGMIKDFSAEMGVAYSPNKEEYGFRFYFGPNHYQTLKDYNLKLEKVIPLGGSLISWINTGFYIPVMNWLHRHIASYGLIILLLTLMVKIIIMPLTYKSYMSSAKMKALKPEIDAINERYPNQEDAMKKQQATMALYKQFGVSPMGGCLPQLIQLPILIALFRFFPASIELRGERFLWAEDLSAYDSIIDLPFKIPFYGDHVSLFALLMALTMFFYSKITYKQQEATAAGQQMAGMKFMMLYLMPIMMLCFLNSYASGLTYYYTLSQLFTIAIMTGFKYFTSDEKLRAKMEVNAKKIATKAPKQKSGFQKRYEEALRQQQAMQREQQGGKAHTAKPQSTNRQPAKKRKK